MHFKGLDGWKTLRLDTLSKRDLMSDIHIIFCFKPNSIFLVCCQRNHLKFNGNVLWLCLKSPFLFLLTSFNLNVLRLLLWASILPDTSSVCHMILQKKRHSHHWHCINAVNERPLTIFPESYSMLFFKRGLSTQHRAAAWQCPVLKDDKNKNNELIYIYL